MTADSDKQRNEAPGTDAGEIIPEVPASDLAKRDDGKQTLSEVFLANRWKKGKSGNPAGRPKGSGVTDRLRTILAEGDNGKDVADALARAAFAAALKGDFRFWKEIVDRVDGPVKQQLEASVAMYAKAIDPKAFDGA